MIQAEERKNGKKRSLGGIFDDIGDSTTTKQRKQLALDGVSICLTGMPLDEKERLHRIIEDLGGQ